MKTKGSRSVCLFDFTSFLTLMRSYYGNQSSKPAFKVVCFLIQVMNKWTRLRAMFIINWCIDNTCQNVRQRKVANWRGKPCNFIMHSHFGQSEDWIFCVSLVKCTINVWRLRLFRICWHIKCQLKRSADTLIKFVWDDPALYAYLDLAEGLYDATQ